VLTGHFCSPFALRPPFSLILRPTILAGKSHLPANNPLWGQWGARHPNPTHASPIPHEIQLFRRSSQGAYAKMEVRNQKTLGPPS